MKYQDKPTSITLGSDNISTKANNDNNAESTQINPTTTLQSSQKSNEEIHNEFIDTDFYVQALNQTPVLTRVLSNFNDYNKKIVGSFSQNEEVDAFSKLKSMCRDLANCRNMLTHLLRQINCSLSELYYSINDDIQNQYHKNTREFYNNYSLNTLSKVIFHCNNSIEETHRNISQIMRSHVPNTAFQLPADKDMVIQITIELFKALQISTATLLMVKNAITHYSATSNSPENNLQLRNMLNEQLYQINYITIAMEKNFEQANKYFGPLYNEISQGMAQNMPESQIKNIQEKFEFTAQKITSDDIQFNLHPQDTEELKKEINNFKLNVIKHNNEKRNIKSSITEDKSLQAGSIRPPKLLDINHTQPYPQLEPQQLLSINQQHTTIAQNSFAIKEDTQPSCWSNTLSESRATLRKFSKELNG